MRVIDDTTVYRNPHPQSRSIVASGSTLALRGTHATEPELLCAFRVGEAKMSADGRIRLRSSRDLGSTWHDVPSAFDAESSATSLAGPHLGTGSDGSAVLACARMRVAAPGTTEWTDEAAGLVDADTTVVRSAPGEPWSSGTELDLRRHGDEWAIPCGPPIALGDRGWLLPMERHTKTHIPDWLTRYHAFAALSTDDGCTWTAAAPMLNDPSHRLAYYDQRVAVLGDGALLSMAWVHDVVDDVTLNARAAISHDQGQQWLEPFDTGLLGGPVNPLTLRDGRTFVVFNRRSPPSGVRAALSIDQGRTWDGPEFVIFDETQRTVVGEPADVVARRSVDSALWSTMWGWTFGTPTPVELPDGSIGITFYWTGADGVTGIRFVRLAVDDDDYNGSGRRPLLRSRTVVSNGSAPQNDQVVAAAQRRGRRSAADAPSDRRAGSGLVGDRRADGRLRRRVLR